MARQTATLSGALEHSVDFAREAWREAWAPLALQALGVAMVYLSFQAPLGFGAAFLMGLTGLVMSLAASPPAWGALYRLALGVRVNEIGPAGLQWDETETRLTMVWGMFALLLAVIWFPLGAAAGLALLLFHDAGAVYLGVLGKVQIGFLAALGIMVLSGIGWWWLMLRLSLASAATVAEGKVMVFDAWPLTAGRALKIGVAWFVLHLPTAATWCLALLLTVIEAKASGTWKSLPLPEAVGTALVIGAVSGFMQTPLAIGAFGYFHRPRPTEVASPLRFAEGL